MKLQGITNGIVSHAHGAYGAIKDFVFWGGHKIRAGFANYLVPAIKAVWTGLTAGTSNVVHFLRTGPGVVFTVAAGLIVAGFAAYRLSYHPNYEGEEQQTTRLALRALGGAALASATLAAGAGIAMIAL
jgi:hypothetical protein